MVGSGLAGLVVVGSEVLGRRPHWGRALLLARSERWLAN